MQTQKKFLWAETIPSMLAQMFGKFMLDLRFKVIEADQCLFIRDEEGKRLLVALYGDDRRIAPTH